MPELIKAPVNPVWPPAASNKRARVVGTRMLSNGKKTVESLLDIANAENVAFDELVKLNFGVTPTGANDEWARIINWYLKNKLNCTRLTPAGNFIFSGGETIYIPTKPTPSPSPAVAPKPPPVEKRTGFVILLKTVINYREFRHADDANPLALKMGERLGDWLRGTPSVDPNSFSTYRVLLRNFTQVPMNQVLVKRMLYRYRKELPGQWDQTNSYNERVEITNYYGKGGPKTKVTLIEHFVFEKAYGAITVDFTESKMIDQPDPDDPTY